MTKKETYQFDLSQLRKFIKEPYVIGKHTFKQENNQKYHKTNK